MTEQHPTLSEVVAKGREFYDAISRFLQDNPAAMTAVEEGDLDVDLDDVIRRVKAIKLCEFCDCAPCRCGQGERR